MRSLPLLAFALAACATPDASAPEVWDGQADPAPPPGWVEVHVGAVGPGGLARVTTTGVTGDEEVHVVLSTRPDGPVVCPGMLGGDCLDIAGPVIRLGEARDRGEDYASLAFPVPVGAPEGRTVWFQVLIDSEEDGWYLGPVVEATVGWMACVDVWDPVCGIDGETYSNECDASTAGWPLAYDGPC